MIHEITRTFLLKNDKEALVTFLVLEQLIFDGIGPYEYHGQKGIDKQKGVEYSLERITYVSDEDGKEIVLSDDEKSLIYYKVKCWIEENPEEIE